MTYKPQPGTIPHRAVRHLKTLPAGAEPSTADLAEALDVPANSLPPTMRAALDAGVVLRVPFVTPSGRQSYRWKLGEAQAVECEEEVLPVIQRTVPAQRFNATVWGGSLVLVGVRGRHDGAVVLTPEQTQHVRGLVAA